MDEFMVMTLLVVIANGIFDAVVVAAIAGKRSKAALVSWMQSPEATPYMDMIADRAMLRITPITDKLNLSVDSMNGQIQAFHTKVDLIQTSISAVTDATKSLPNMNGELSQFRKTQDGMISDVQENIRANIEDLQNQTLTALNTQLNAAVETIRTEIVASIDGKLKSFEAVKQKQLNKALKQFGLQVNEMGEAVQGEILSDADETGMSPYHVAALNILSQTPSEEFMANNPTAAMLWKTAQVQGIKALQTGLSEQKKGTTLNKNNGNVPTNNSGIFR